jgi:glutamate/aspartate transport system substrate-binding protein
MKFSRLSATVIAAAVIATTASAADLNGTLKKIHDSGSISLGVRETSIPFSYQDDKQAYQGYSVDLCLKVAQHVQKELGLASLKVAYTPDTAATRIPLLTNGTIDLQCDGASNTAERQKQVAFSPTVFLTGNRLLARKSSNIHSLADMKGKAIVSLSGTTNIKQIAELDNEQKLGMKIVTAAEHSDAFLMLESGRVTAYANDDIHLAALIANAKAPGDYAISDQAMSFDPYGLMFRRDDPAFKKAVDTAIVNLFKSGEIDRIYAKWFQSPIPPKGANLQWPIQPKLRAAFTHPTDSSDPASYALAPAAPAALANKK